MMVIGQGLPRKLPWRSINLSGVTWAWSVLRPHHIDLVITACLPAKRLYWCTKCVSTTQRWGFFHCKHWLEEWQFHTWGRTQQNMFTQPRSSLGSFHKSFSFVCFPTRQLDMILQIPHSLSQCPTAPDPAVAFVLP